MTRQDQILRSRLRGQSSASLQLEIYLGPEPLSLYFHQLVFGLGSLEYTHSCN
jgi:hypothetical protein